MKFACLLIMAVHLASSLVFAEDRAAKAGLPAITLHADGFPTGRTSPEGAASDLVRAYIAQDFELFNAARFTKACEGRNDPGTYYKKFLIHTPFVVRDKAKADDPPAPTKITKVHAARHFKPGADEVRMNRQIYNTMYEVAERRFVDVVVTGDDGRTMLNRTLVMKKKNGNWYAEPRLHERPLMKRELDEEGASTRDFRDAYSVLPRIAP